MQITHFFAATDLTVLGYNPEMADIDHPRGEIVGYAGYIYAEDDQGNRRRFFVSSGRSEQAILAGMEKQVAALQTRLRSGKPPVAFHRWEECRPAYGSQAYSEYGQWNDLQDELVEDEVI